MNSNYDDVRKKAGLTRREFDERYARRNTFVNGAARSRLLGRLNRGLGKHVHAEGSASLHVADISDRIRMDDEGNFEIRLAYPPSGHWPMATSMLLQLHATKGMALCFGVAGELKPHIEAVFGFSLNGDSRLDGDGTANG